jgi:hypothetical protein
MISANKVRVILVAPALIAILALSGCRFFQKSEEEPKEQTEEITPDMEEEIEDTELEGIEDVEEE